MNIIYIAALDFLMHLILLHNYIIIIKLVLF